MIDFNKTMRLIFAFILIFVFNTGFSQEILFTEQTSSQTTYVKGKNFEGTIFSKEYQMPFSENPSQDRRFTPTIKDIELVEKLLREQLKKINNGLNQGKHLGPKIHKKLKKYQRQYIGYVSEDGENLIYLSCNWQRHNLFDKIRGFTPPRDSWKTDFWIVFDGGSYHWNLKINLDREELVDLGVNGIA